MSQRDYILANLSELSTEKSEYSAKLKIVRLDTQTYWLDITDEQLEKIKKVLTEEPVKKG